MVPKTTTAVEEVEVEVKRLSDLAKAKKESWKLESFLDEARKEDRHFLHPGVTDIRIEYSFTRPDCNGSSDDESYSKVVQRVFDTTVKGNFLIEEIIQHQKLLLKQPIRVEGTEWHFFDPSNWHSFYDGCEETIFFEIESVEGI